MKKLLAFLALSASVLSAEANQPDSVYVKSYRIGNCLRVSYSLDKLTWTPVGNGHNLLSSDFGAWGAEKKMQSEPSVLRDTDGQWYAVWAVNDRVHQFATTHTHDLACWAPQDYPYTTTADENVINPVLTKRGNLFVVTYSTSKGNTYETTSSDFIHWSAARSVQGGSASLNVTRAPWSEISALTTKAEAAAYRASRDNGGMENDCKLFANVKDMKATLTADLSKSKAISPNLFGIFFEDINYAADGGLYAELLQNRDFEYKSTDHDGWDAKTAWKADNGLNWEIATDNPIHKNNSTYSIISLNESALPLKGNQEGLSNEGWDGISLKKGDKYDFSIFLKALDGKAMKVKVQLKDGDKVIAEKVLTASADWKQQKAVLVSSATVQRATLCITPMASGRLALDFASLFPQKTFKNRKNGMRADLAQTLADLHPRFVRFPGGCASHGNGIDNIYHWQASIGKLWERQSDRNIWNYHQSRGIGFYEYFQFCEDIGAQPLPVLSAGVPCQNSSIGGDGQEGGIPWEKDLKDGKSPYTYNGQPLTMESYLQELLDLIEWANGDAKTSKLAKLRAEAGHPKPFGLKMLGIGNEDLFSNVFLERYTWLINKVREAHPEIRIVGTVGPFWEGSDYETGWNVAREQKLSIVDEHYYNPVNWYLNHQDFYDKYSRAEGAPKVYLGEWASKGNRWENALAEAIHITNVERNADIVEMSSYAPLLARDGHFQWAPDMIFFNNEQVKLTPNYYVQMLSGQNNGKDYIYSDMNVSDPACSQRVKASIVRAENGDIIIKLVNALPVETPLALNLGDLSAYTSATMKQISDKWDADWVKPATETKISVSNLANMTLPAYSFSVIRLSSNKK